MSKYIVAFILGLVCGMLLQVAFPAVSTEIPRRHWLGV